MKQICYHLGAGPIRLAGFVNVDHEASHGPDLCIDYLKLGEHVPDGTVDVIYSCHSVEHLEWDAGVRKFFEVTLKALKPGGVLRLCVPDLMKVARKYVAGEDLRDIYDGPYWTYRDTPATRFMWFARGWDHTVLFDETLLRILFGEAGFVNVAVRPFGDSPHVYLWGLDRFESESICIEGEKPV